jgi:hypothetical protein
VLLFSRKELYHVNLSMEFEVSMRFVFVAFAGQDW